jgi:hypothetical protein
LYNNNNNNNNNAITTCWCNSHKDSYRNRAGTESKTLPIATTKCVKTDNKRTGMRQDTA